MTRPPNAKISRKNRPQLFEFWEGAVRFVPFDFAGGPNDAPGTALTLAPSIPGTPDNISTE